MTTLRIHSYGGQKVLTSRDSLDATTRSAVRGDASPVLQQLFVIMAV
jgi:hypothetical protein